MKEPDLLKNIIEEIIKDGITYRNEMLELGRGYDLKIIAELSEEKLKDVFKRIIIDDINKYCKQQLMDAREFAEAHKDNNIAYTKYMGKYFAYKDVSDWIELNYY